MTKRVNVLGVGISVLNLRTALDAIAAAVRERRKGYICVTGVHGVMEAQDDENSKKFSTARFSARRTACRWSGREN
jgi:N-acetylglucosaminyldiphosphoundecaprenol N-acetyl-beta-D-mannosaminyltransferase